MASLRNLSPFLTGNTTLTSGCSGASDLIHSLGLEEYYSIKNFDKHKEAEDRDSEKGTEDYSYLNQENFKKLYTKLDFSGN